MERSSIIKIVYYMAVSQGLVLGTTEFTNWLAEIDIKSGIDFPF